MPPLVRRLFISGILIAALVGFVAAGFLAWIGDEGGLTPVPPATTGAEEIQDIYVFVGAFASAIFLVVTIPIALFVAGFRGRGRDRSAEGPQIRGNTRLEIAWTIVPILILIAIVVFVLIKLPGIREPASAAGEAQELRIRVEGRQFYFRYVYPNGAIGIDRLRLPVDRVTTLVFTAPEHDVIHSWWVPALGGKFDSIPGQETEFRYLPTKTGVFEGRCGELCGLQHGAMLATAEVLPAAEYERWVEQTAQAQRAGSSELGEQLYTGVCAKCHDLAPEFAPQIAGSPILADREAVAEIVQNGRGRMPPVGRGWTNNELDALLDFVETIAGRS
jgi:cytochrome c oxidase subunit II